MLWFAVPARAAATRSRYRCWNSLAASPCIDQYQSRMQADMLKCIGVPCSEPETWHKKTEQLGAQGAAPL